MQASFPTLWLLAIGCGDVALEPGPKPDARADDAQVSDSNAVDADPFAPAKLTGLALWLDGDAGVAVAGGKVISWEDQSGNGNHAVDVPVGNRPTQATTLINGHNSIHFDGIDDHVRVADSASLQWGTGDFTIVVVARYGSLVSGTQALYNKQVELAPYTGVFVYSIGGSFAGKTDGTGTASVTAPSAGTHIVALTRRQEQVRLTIDASSSIVNLSAAANINASGIDVTLGGRYQAIVQSQPFAGEIAEVVAVRGTTSEADVTALVGYLAAKYSITL